MKSAQIKCGQMNIFFVSQLNFDELNISDNIPVAGCQLTNKEPCQL